VDGIRSGNGGGASYVGGRQAAATEVMAVKERSRVSLSLSLLPVPHDLAVLVRSARSASLSFHDCIMLPSLTLVSKNCLLLQDTVFTWYRQNVTGNHSANDDKLMSVSTNVD